MQRRLPFPVRVLGPVLVLAVALAGCGSAEKSDPASADDGTVAPTRTETPAAPTDLCSAVTAAEISTALGSEVTTQTGPSGDCELTSASIRGLSGSIGVVLDADTNGGYSAYVAGLDATITKAATTELSGLGDAAVVKVGLPSMGGSENNTAAGVVDHGSYLVQVTLVQGLGMSADELAGVAEKLLSLVEAKTA